MARTVRHSKLDSRTARRRLKTGRQPHWQALTPGIHVGYQRKKSGEAGRWLLRRYAGRVGGADKQYGKYSLMPIGLADDEHDANGTTVLNYDQALAKAQAMASTPDG